MLRRVMVLMGALTVAGTLYWALRGGSRSVIGFLGGAAISAVSLWMLTKLSSDFAGAMEGRKPSPFGVIIHAFRMLLLGAAAYVIVRVCGASPAVLATGLLVTVGAITLEALYEVLYAS